jgi:hypothetical protein
VQVKQQSYVAAELALAAVVLISLLEPEVTKMNHVTRVSQIRVAAALIKFWALATVSHVVPMELTPAIARWKVYAATMVMMLNATRMTVSDSIRQRTKVVFKKPGTYAAVSQATLHKVAAAHVNQMASLASNRLVHTMEVTSTGLAAMG